MVAALAITLFIALALLANSGNIYLFVRHDVLTNFDRLIFVCGFPIAYSVSLLACHHLIKIPSFDIFNRIIFVNLIVYSFLGLLLSILRIHLYSRPVVLTEFIVSTILLAIFFSLWYRTYPRRLGILPDTDIKRFNSFQNLHVDMVNTENVQLDKFDAIALNLHQGDRVERTKLLTAITQKRIPVYDVNYIIENLSGRVPLVELTDSALRTFTPPDFYLPIKRIIDIILVLFLSPLAICLSLIIAIVIKLESRGPILFSQKRTGLHGTEFDMLKFRSMTNINEPDSFTVTEQLKTDSSRVTYVGRFIRRLRLDEIPQMWNVLRGEMSLIGPRPEQIRLTERFHHLIPYYGFRHTIRPGISGWAQVMYPYTVSDDQTRIKLEYDLFYIKHMSPWIDLIVIIRTIRTIMFGVGSSSY
jgi:lipopolysaccharide/colanic/teichoic acid biosynthesis glycosyltransferase/uncharacterized MnhB-related membrane protein